MRAMRAVRLAMRREIGLLDVQSGVYLTEDAQAGRGVRVVNGPRQSGYSQPC